MAGKWAMAKAFGRAMMEPLKAKNAGKVRDEVGSIAKKLDAGPREAYGEGVTEGFNDLGKAIQFEKKRKIPELRKRMDELSDKATNESLQDDFDEAFDEALSKRVKIQSEAETRTEPADIKELDDYLRKEAIEVLKDPNSSIQDVLDLLNNYND